MEHKTGNNERVSNTEVLFETCALDFYPVDFTVLTELFGDDKQKIRKMIEKFVESSRLDMKKIEAAMVLKDYAAIGRLAHFIRGPSGMIGATGLAKLCMELEAHCANCDKENRALEVIGRMYLMLDQIDEQTNKYFR